MSPQYAASTSVSVAKTRDEIERTLTKYGATAFSYGWNGSKSLVQFAAHDRQIRFVLPLPDKADKAFTLTPSGQYKRSAVDAEKAWEQACRQRWRALLLVLKAKLEAVEAGIVTFESEFMSHVVLPNGTTAGEWLAPQIEEAYTSGKMPRMLPELGTGG